MISPEDLGVSRLRDYVRHVDVNVDLVPLKFTSEDNVEIYLPGSGYYNLDI